ncbi:nitrate/sulfonate/bicarbonate ABC transporter ATP-binding protein [Leptolyngbya sp. 'hensonii']|uniref:ABC transporter ATP-binding protein n=1 Tax=Leptolyngbya sp. 'hensonii' TaxID=1922337 RepID=UPI00094F84ED|nr:ABC transporter ATP-binding protein [Leptolyngbya sp. 'hensonii']OLP17646.1 nitrate/sulfonate/bicarbonate ABC transporter ATP-binding protein [Leptolyngbya sp. 'hensonii']
MRTTAIVTFSESNVAVSLNQVSKVYSNGTVALQDMTLTIGASEFVSLVGPSGCGKSTVLKLIAGLGQMSSGRIHWEEPPSQTTNPSGQHRLAYVFQDAALMPWADVQTNVRLPLKLVGMARQEMDARVEDAIARVGLKGFERAYPRELSGGMKMRVSIARALVTDPSILLMDEPFGALDELTRSRLNGDLLHLWYQKHWTVIFVTHNIYEAVYLSNRVIVMAARPGRVIAEVPIATPYPREEEFRTSPEFNSYCREISHQLSETLRYALP